MNLQDVMDSKDSVNEKLKDIEALLKVIKAEQTILWKARANINSHLKVMCEHDWRREAYMYSPLYCAKCGVER